LNVYARFSITSLKSDLQLRSKIDQISKAQLDKELEEELRAKGFGHLLDD
jgi:hypothetical protein